MRFDSAKAMHWSTVSLILAFLLFLKEGHSFVKVEELLLGPASMLAFPGELENKITSFNLLMGNNPIMGLLITEKYY